MKLSIFSWNINFIHDKWLDRLKLINSELKKHIEDIDIIAFQEATLPFSDKAKTLYNFLEEKDLNFFIGPELFFEREFLYNKIDEYFPKNKLAIKGYFDFFMNILLDICGYIFGNWGEYLKDIYFNHTYIFGLLVIFFPFIFVLTWFFVGMITITSKRLKTNVQSKYIGRAIQYCNFKFNKRDVFFVNVHLTPGIKKTNKRVNEVKKLIEMCKNKEIAILAGDFNDTPDSEIYKILSLNNFKTVSMKKNKLEKKTFPSNNPEKCIDYIWIKGKDIEIDDLIYIKSENATDHIGIKAILNINTPVKNDKSKKQKSK